MMMSSPTLISKSIALAIDHCELQKPTILNITYIAKFDSKNRNRVWVQEFNLQITDCSRKKTFHRRQKSYRLI